MLSYVSSALPVVPRLGLKKSEADTERGGRKIETSTNVAARGRENKWAKE